MDKYTSLAIATSIILMIAITCISLARHFEKKAFNNGICPRCGKKLRYFGSDSQGGRGYCCNDCRYTTWCSYNVDKNYKE